MPDPSPTFDSYPVWAEATFDARFDRYEELFFETNVQKIKGEAENHQFFRELQLILDSLAREFEQANSARLFAQPRGSLTLCTKPWQSALEKSFRANVVRNKDFPSPPMTGWVTPTNWYRLLNDLVRGTLVFSYLDALPWVADRLKGEAKKRGLDLVFNPEVRDEGYYAFHVYATLPKTMLEIRKGDQVVEEEFEPQVEIQLTTQLQDALYEVTHFYYEKRRLEGLAPDWKWKHDQPQFRASYISHALHLVDALIVELRERVRVAREPAAVPTTQVGSRSINSGSLPSEGT